MTGIGQRVRTLRERRGWSQEQLGLHAGLSTNAVCRAEKDRQPRGQVETILRLAAALQVTPGQLLGELPIALPPRTRIVPAGYSLHCDDCGPVATVGTPEYAEQVRDDHLDWHARRAAIRDVAAA